MNSVAMKCDASIFARWFMKGDSIDGPEQDMEREIWLANLYKFTEYGVSEKSVALKFPGGRAILEVKEVQGCKMIDIDCISDNKWLKKTFWMNASSLKDLSDMIKTHPERKVSFDSIFCAEISRNASVA